MPCHSLPSEDLAAFTGTSYHFPISTSSRNVGKVFKIVQGGIGSTIDENPFKDWTFIVIPYASGDFHTGTGEYHYTQDGTDKTVYHNGYNNYSAFIDEIEAYVGEPASRQEQSNRIFTLSPCFS